MTDQAPSIDAGIDLLLDEVFHQSHYDFRSYSRVHVHRRVARAQSSIGASSIRELRERVAREPATLSSLLHTLTIQVSDLFRDAGYYQALRKTVLPHLATYPSPRIWVAGCGGGEEAYSIAILLHEEGLLNRSFIYATDIDARSLRSAESGTYDLERVRGFTDNYFRAGGRASLSDYYTAAYSGAVFRPFLRKRILFSDHCLATDAAFAEVHLVSCRNVLIYFDRSLQDRAVGLFHDSLCPRGFLGLGPKETLSFSKHAPAFAPWADGDRVYRVR